MTQRYDAGTREDAGDMPGEQSVAGEEDPGSAIDESDNTGAAKPKDELAERVRKARRLEEVDTPADNASTQEERLDESLEDTFPASDPVAPSKRT
jgi:hypothetical protein